MKFQLFLLFLTLILACNTLGVFYYAHEWWGCFETMTILSLIFYVFMTAFFAGWTVFLGKEKFADAFLAACSVAAFLFIIMSGLSLFVFQ